MLKLSDLYKELLTEDVDRNSIIKAIQDKRLINIYYDSPHGTEDKGWRRIEPFCYGINNYDNSVLRAWQIHGPSDSYPEGKPNDPLTHIPGWRMFRIDGIKQINEAGNDRFTAPRPKYNPDDKDMKIIYAAANFDNSNSQEVAPETQPTVGTPTTTQTPSTTVTPPPATTSPFASTQKTAQDYGDTDGVTDIDNPLNLNKDTTSSETEPVNKPNWFTKFGDKFKNIVNFGKTDNNKI